MNDTRIPTLDPLTGPAPMGVNLMSSGGATVKVWAPSARQVSLRWDYDQNPDTGWRHRQEAYLQRLDGGLWGGFAPSLRDGDRYMFYVVGPEGGDDGLKRDPHARDLSDDPAWPDCQCLICDPSNFTWHDTDYRPPPFHQMVIYQFHIGTWFIPKGRNNGTFLDVAGKLPYLRTLGINAIQPLPVVEFPTMFSLGYNGVDYFSPETDYGVRANDPALSGYLDEANQLLRDIDPNLAPYTRSDIEGTANQLRMLVDLCHLHGIAVILDVVYNHAGGNFTDRGLFHFDGVPRGNLNDSLYFTDHGWAGGLVFAYWKDEVKQFLIDNARYYLTEFHTDGFRYDEVSVIRNEGGEHGWLFCRYLTDTCHFVKPEAIHIAEHWPVDGAITRSTDQGGAGFDAAQNDGLREALRGAIGQAAAGADAFVNMDGIARALSVQPLGGRWRAVQCSENHDIVYRGRGSRVVCIADGSNSRSWYARSRARVALGLTVTAPGIPHLFMGQEFLEDKQWHDQPGSAQVWWQGLGQDRSMTDFLRFSQDLIGLRRRLEGLNGEGLNVFHVHNGNRVLAFHRWVPGTGHDVVVVASLAEHTWPGYALGFPRAGYWSEVFNSDVYDHWVNPRVAGNGGTIHAMESGLHGLPASAYITIPAGGMLVFTR